MPAELVGPLRDYRLLGLGVGSLAEIDELPAHRLDQLLRIDDVYRQVEEKRRAKQS